MIEGIILRKEDISCQKAFGLARKCLESFSEIRRTTFGDNVVCTNIKLDQGKEAD